MDEVLRMVGVSGVLHSNPIPNILAWKGLARGKRSKKAWTALFFCVVWSIWLEWYNVKIENRVWNWNHLWGLIKNRLGHWLKALVPGFNFPHLILATNLQQILKPYYLIVMLILVMLWLVCSSLAPLDYLNQILSYKSPSRVPESIQLISALSLLIILQSCFQFFALCRLCECWQSTDLERESTRCHLASILCWC